MMESPGPVVRCESCDYTTPVDCPAQYVIQVLELHSIGAHGSPPVSVRCTGCEYVTRPDCPPQVILQLLGIHMKVCSSTSGDMDASLTTCRDTQSSSSSEDTSYTNLSVVDFAVLKHRVEREAREGFTIQKENLDTGEEVDTVVTAPSLELEPGVYADDSSYVNATDTEEELRHAAVLVDRQVVHYFTVNGHAVNNLKRETMSIMNRFSEPIKVGEVSSQSQIKLLGLKCTDKMSFYPQAIDVVSKISAKLPGILRMKPWASPELLKRTAHSCLISHMEYLLQCYGGELRVQTLLQKCLNRFMRGLLGRDQMAPVEPMLTELDWLNIPNLVRFKTLFWFRETDRANQAPYTWDKLESSRAIHGHNTRRLRLEPTFRPQSMASSLSFIHRGSSLYSALNLYPDLSEGEEYKDLVRSKLISRFGNGNL